MHGAVGPAKDVQQRGLGTILVCTFRVCDSMSHYARTTVRLCTLLLLLTTCATGAPARSSSPTSESTARPERETHAGSNSGQDMAKDECKTILDCMRVRGVPPAGLEWNCELGLCAAQFVSKAIVPK